MAETWQGTNGERYYLREEDTPWRRVTQEEFISYERAAGFWPKGGHGVATGGFRSGANATRGAVPLSEHVREAASPMDDLSIILCDCSCGKTYSIPQGVDGLVERAELDAAHQLHIEEADLGELR